MVEIAILDGERTVPAEAVIVADAVWSMPAISRRHGLAVEARRPVSR